jgi:transcriptional regulator with XRE-family HTH domain
VQQNLRERFGLTVHDLRAGRGWTHEELNHRAGIGRVFISQLENGHKDTCLGVIEAVGDTFNVTHSELISEL